VLISTEEELRRCFREIDRSDVEVGDLRLPLRLGRSLVWTFGTRAYLVFRAPKVSPRGIVFHREATPSAVAMCDWCHTQKGQGRVRLLTARTSDRRTIGLYLCSDLACIQNAGTVSQAISLASSRLF
jgi:hypothetical protein